MSLYEKLAIGFGSGLGRKVSTLFGLLPNNNLAEIVFTRNGTGNATEVEKNGLIQTVPANIPRSDFKNGCGSLLSEPESTNSALWSEDFTQAFWTKTNTTITSNTTIAPDGTLTADTITANSSNADLQGSYVGLSGVSYATSFYVKRKTGTGGFRLRGVDNISTLVDVTDEWTRVSIVNISSSTTIRVGVRIDTLGDEFYIWGGQSEQQSYATSYIKTEGATEIRIADTFTDYTGLSVSTEGVLYVEASNLGFDGVEQVVSINDATANNTVLAGFDTTENDVLVFLRVGGVTLLNANQNVPSTTSFNRIAIIWKDEFMQAYVNGVLVDQSGGNTFGVNLSRFSIRRAGGTTYRGRIKEYNIFNKSDIDVEAMTMWNTFEELATNFEFEII